MVRGASYHPQLVVTCKPERPQDQAVAEKEALETYAKYPALEALRSYIEENLPYLGRDDKLKKILGNILKDAERALLKDRGDPETQPFFLPLAEYFQIPDFEEIRLLVSPGEPTCPFLFISKAKLGEGGYKAVVRAFNPKNPAAPRCAYASNASANTEEEFCQEIAYLRKLSSPHVIPVLLGAKDAAKKWHLVMPLCDLKLGQAWKKWRETRPWVLLAMLYQSARGLSYLHENRIVHSDISPGNLMVRYDPEQGQWIMQIIDLGLARACGDPPRSCGQPDLKKPHAGVEVYRSPENLLLQTEINQFYLKDAENAAQCQRCKQLIIQMQQSLKQIEVEEERLSVRDAEDPCMVDASILERFTQLENLRMQTKTRLCKTESLEAQLQQRRSELKEELIQKIARHTQPSTDVWALACSVLDTVTRREGVEELIVQFFPHPQPSCREIPSYEALKHWQPARDLPNPLCHYIPSGSSLDVTLRRVFPPMLAFNAQDRCSAEDVCRSIDRSYHRIT
jgi:serine/threonine protein kinase